MASLIEEGGFVPNLRTIGGFRRRKPQTVRLQDPKSAADRRAELAAAKRRWRSVPPMVAARELLAERPNLSDGFVRRKLAELSQLPEHKQAEAVTRLVAELETLSITPAMA